MTLTQKEIDAFNQVKSTVAALRDEYDTICADISAKEKHLAELPNMPVPVADFKAAILDLVDARGKNYINEFVKPSITAFATHMMGGSGTDIGVMGYPLNFIELESAIDGTGGALSYAQLITQMSKAQFNDIALYAFCGELVKAGLTVAMETMSDEDFGYDKITQAQIGSDRATRRAAIQATREQLAALTERKEAVRSSLRQLGVEVKG